MKVEDILKEKGTYIYYANENSFVCKILNDFNNKKIGSCIVRDDNNKITGIMTERDALKCYNGKTDLSKIKIKEMMTPAKKLIIASFDDDIQYIMSMMTNKRIKHIPVFKDNEIFGIISIGDVVKALLKRSTQIAKTYLDHILGKTTQEDNIEY